MGEQGKQEICGTFQGGVDGSLGDGWTTVGLGPGQGF